MDRLAAGADRLLRGVAALLLFALLTSVVLGVVSRQLNEPLSWTDELAQYLLVWMGFAGWMIASRRQGHIRILFLANMLRGAPRVALEVVTQAAIAVLGAAMIWYSFRLIGRNLDVESISVPFPAAVMYMPLPLLGVALMLQAAADAYGSIDAGRVDASEGEIL